MSSPTAVTSIVTGPLDKVNPACSSSPSLTSTGTDSPVRGALFTDPIPDMISPSAGINSPLLISMWSPFMTNPTGISSTSEFLGATGASDIGLEEIEIEDIENLSNFFFGTLLAVLGNLSKPPCIAFLALIKASFSICSVHATKIKTINASSHA